MVVTNKTFTQDRITLDGFTYKDCTFDRCLLIYSGYQSTTLIKVNMINCSFIFEGPAHNTFNFLKMMHNSSAKEQIENLLNMIKGEEVQYSQEVKYDA